MRSGPVRRRRHCRPGFPVTELHGHWVLPGFVDMHVHGGGGASFTAGPADDARRAAAFHRGHGSTTIVASLVTAPLADLEARAAMLAALAERGIVAGIHLEGPFLSVARCGPRIRGTCSLPTWPPSRACTRRRRVICASSPSPPNSPGRSA